jgi:succinate dehydrogenase/fumarate reductase flavoprotein subunit
MGINRTARAVNYEWLDAIDTVNMLEACELIIQSSLERKESRGPFMRRDFPDTDNARWLAATRLRTVSGSSNTPTTCRSFSPALSKRTISR